MSTLKIVEVKISKFTKERNATALLKIGQKCFDDGSDSVLFGVPNISLIDYAEGTFAIEALDESINIHDDAPTSINLGIVKNKMALLVLWLIDFAGQVVVIANNPLNCTTLQEAGTNIGIAGLSYRKIGKSSTGKPIQIALTGGNIGTGVAQVEVVPDVDFGPKSTTFIAVSKAPITNPPTPDALVTLDEDGQLSVLAYYVFQIFIVTVEGKGRFAKFKKLTPALGYNSYAFSKNGNKLFGKLSKMPLLIFG